MCQLPTRIRASAKQKYTVIIIITLPTQRDCPAPGQLPALIGRTAGYQERKHKGITLKAVPLLMSTVSVVLLRADAPAEATRL